jgi:hypothetical protein
MDDLFVVGRLIFGGFFLFNGANHFLMNAMMVQYASAKAFRCLRSRSLSRVC